MNIGLTQTIHFHNNKAYDALEHGWYHYLKGHTLFPICNNMNQDFVSIANKLDVLIITGGVDLASRRAVELKLASEMMKQLKPILGVCHGALLITDILGGDISEDKTHLDVDHNITYMNQTYKVRSHHSNVITNPHDQATVLATDSDGHCEAWIDGNIAGIMWQPQRMDKPFLPTEIANKFQF